MQSETPWFSRENSVLCCVDLTPQYWHHVHVASILKTARNAYFIPLHCALKHTCAYVVTRYHRQLVMHNWCLTRNLLPSKLIENRFITQLGKISEDEFALDFHQISPFQVRSKAMKAMIIVHQLRQSTVLIRDANTPFWINSPQAFVICMATFDK